MIDNPEPEQYSDPVLIRMSNDFSAVYTQLLSLLHKAFNGSPAVMGEATVAMMSLGPLARGLLNNPVAGGEKCAGPCFRYLASAR